MRRKRGAANLEFVLSFVIFVVFLVFLYNGLDPIIKTAGSKQFILGHLKLALLENLTLSDFTVQTFTIQTTALQFKTTGNPNDCVKINGGQLSQHLADGKRLTIKNVTGDKLNYSDDGGNIIIGPIDNTFNGFLKFYYASEFKNKSDEYTGGKNCILNINFNEYDIATITEKEIISSSNVDTIQAAYFANYDLLKDILGIPFGNDFTVGFQTIGLRLDDGEIIWPTNSLEPPSDVNVYVGEFPIQYIDEEANIKIGFLVVKVW